MTPQEAKVLQAHPINFGEKVREKYMKRGMIKAIPRVAKDKVRGRVNDPQVGTQPHRPHHPTGTLRDPRPVPTPHIPSPNRDAGIPGEGDTGIHGNKITPMNPILHHVPPKDTHL